MEEKKMEQAQPEKMTYEQLENVAKELSQQNRMMYNKLQEISMENTFKRLDYLFKVVEFEGSFSSAFQDKCIEEIETLMTIPEEDKKEE